MKVIENSLCVVDTKKAVKSKTYSFSNVTDYRVAGYNRLAKLCKIYYS